MGEEEETEKNTPGDQESDRVKNRKRTKEEEEEEEGVVSDALARVLLSSLSSRTGHLFYLFFSEFIVWVLGRTPLQHRQTQNK